MSGYPIFDAHAHAFPDAVAPGAMASLIAGARWEKVQAFHDGTVAGLLKSMDSAKVQCSILCSVATRPTQVQKITAWSAAIASERIIPFASVHPDYEEVEAEVERIAALGLKGLKFHSQYMNCPADDPRVIRMAQAAAKCNLAMAFHGGYDLSYDRSDIASPQRMLHLHKAVPSLRLLVCHLGGWMQWEEVRDYLAGLPIYLETSYTLRHCERKLLEQIMAKHSEDYLLFGTDAPWANQGEERKLFEALKLSEQAKRKGLWENAWGYLGMNKAERAAE